MTSKKPYFPNNIEGVMDTQYFPVDAETVLDNTMLWEIPSSVICIIRAEHKTTGKVEEYSYQRKHLARQRMEKLLVDGEYNVTIADDEQIHLLCPVPLDDEEDD